MVNPIPPTRPFAPAAPAEPLPAPQAAVPVDEVAAPRRIPGFTIHKINKGDKISDILGARAQRAKGERRVWAEARRLGLLATTAPVGGPVSAVLSREAGDSLAELVGDLRAHNVRFRVSGAEDDRLAAGHLRDRYWKGLTVEGGDFAAQPVTSLADVMALDALYVAGDAKGAPQPALVRTLLELQKAGGSFVSAPYEGSASVGMYGAWLRLAHARSSVGVRVDGREIEARGRTAAQALPWFLFDGAVDHVPHAALARDLRRLERDGWQLAAAQHPLSACDAWWGLVNEPGLAVQASRGGPACDLRDLLSEPVKSGLVKRAEMLLARVRPAEGAGALDPEDRGRALDIAADGLPAAGVSPQEAWAALERLTQGQQRHGFGAMSRALDDIQMVVARPLLGRTVGEALSVYADLARELPPGDARVVYGRAADCDVEQQDPYFAAAIRTGSADLVHGLWLGWHRNLPELEPLLQLCDRQRAIDPARRSDHAHTLFNLSRATPLPGLDSATSAHLAQDLADCVQRQHGIAKVEELYRRISSRDRCAERVGRFVEAWSRRPDVQSALEASDRIDLRVEQQESFVTIGGVRIPRRAT